MRRPRGPLCWLLLLLAAACSGILFALFSAAKPHPGSRAGARDAASSQAFFGPTASKAGPRKMALLAPLHPNAQAAILPPPTSTSKRQAFSQRQHCHQPLSLAIQRDPRFRGVFDLSIPVLLWGGLFTRELWDHLSQRKAPYGWQGLSHQVLASTLALLNSSENAGLLAASRRGCARCAVVGNGGILNGSRQGQSIDAHDYVFRLNGAVIKGFERDVGTKTSFYGFTVNTMKNSLISYQKFGFTSVPQGQDLRYIFIPSDIRDYVMLRSAILGIPVPEGRDEGDSTSRQPSWLPGTLLVLKGQPCQVELSRPGLPALDGLLDHQPCCKETDGPYRALAMAESAVLLSTLFLEMKSRV